MYEEDERFMPPELESSVEDLLTRYQVQGMDDRRHYLNRARKFIGEGFPSDRIMESLEKEIKQPPVKLRLRESDWLGSRHVSDDRK